MEQFRIEAVKTCTNQIEIRFMSAFIFVWFVRPTVLLAKYVAKLACDWC